MSKPSSLALARIVLFLCLFSSVLALQVTPGSECAPVCLDQQDGDSLDPSASTNSPDDIVCKNVDFFSSGNGLKFKSCVECLQNSQQVNGTENDISWFLYNLRYASAVCLYGWPTHKKNVSSPCDIDYACHPLRTAIESGNFNPDNETEFGYCDADNKAFQSGSLQACVQCLQASNDQNYLSNFLIALDAGCKQEPAPGQLLGLSGAIFSDWAVNITTPPSNTTAENAKKDNSSMTTGTIVGIAVGGGLALLGAIALFVVYFRRQKRFEREENLLPDFYDKPPRSGTSSITATNSGIGPHFTNDYKSDPPGYELKEQQLPQHIVSHFSNNAEYYDQMEARTRGRGLSQTQVMDLAVGTHSSNSALPTHPAYVPRGYIGGRPSRNASPNLPPPAPKPNKPDSYAIQVYLNATEHSATPPPGVSPPSTSITLNPPPATRSAQSSRQTTPEPQVSSAPPPPPPPPRASKVPSLVLPSVPRIRVPKKYSPPKIQVQEATPIERQGCNDITGPLSYPEERFGLRFNNPEDRVVEQRVAQPQFSPGAMTSGKSLLY